ncbi:alpha-1,3-mannosyl-glycoprotein 2-beta-N-acetylglucosaminyltransferase isoform X1 [Lepeophtheirus salmonis]|uniref:alpha-1,3-mannosyl-glycoprotein 2-beta-N-acetylglucosaminyltransferase isoform X1 n=2 Tax=Lepeophtheirus salmonis TaxID=72036 RepID=UPI001AE90391|nr:alpha-1,3-mannosyl-glycoprotein 2-beta-N-acetylglucosaminyltransferase-like isoform X1 [Lepeophtheirus salmonis]
MRTSNLFLLFSGTLISFWFFICLYYFNSFKLDGFTSQGQDDYSIQNYFNNQVESLFQRIDLVKNETSDIVKRLKGLKRVHSSTSDKVTLMHSWSNVIPILLFACNRVSVSRSINLLLKYRKNVNKFPIIVSQDCGHEATANTIKEYGDALTFIKQPDQSEIQNIPKKEAKFKGYFKIARHYGWALNFTFNEYKADQVIIVEDDLEISPDFFEYFEATLPILRSDPTLWCVSAWNDNGKEKIIDKTKPNLLYRTDFFGGLGWMITRDLWTKELMMKWPRSYWDDWMRHPDQRKGRSCIRPEISRTKTFGKIGVSNGLFFDKHLKYIQLNLDFVPFTRRDMKGLLKSNYDKTLAETIDLSPILDIMDIKNRIDFLNKKSVRVLYKTKNDFKRIAKVLGIMDDFKSGVPRMAYKGIVSTIFEGVRVYVTPHSNWKGYDTTW